MRGCIRCRRDNGVSGASHGDTKVRRRAEKKVAARSAARPPLRSSVSPCETPLPPAHSVISYCLNPRQQLLCRDVTWIDGECRQELTFAFREFSLPIVVLRATAAAVVAASVWLTCRLPRRLGGGPFAEVLAMLSAAVAPMLIGTATFYSMNVLEILIWTSAAYLLVDLLDRPSSDRHSDWPADLATRPAGDPRSVDDSSDRRRMLAAARCCLPPEESPSSRSSRAAREASPRPSCW